MGLGVDWFELSFSLVWGLIGLILSFSLVWGGGGGWFGFVGLGWGGVTHLGPT